MARKSRCTPFPNLSARLARAAPLPLNQPRTRFAKANDSGGEKGEREKLEQPRVRQARDGHLYSVSA